MGYAPPEALVTSTHRFLTCLPLLAALLGCSGLLEPSLHRDPACRCTLETPVHWSRQDLVDLPHLGLGDPFADQYVMARFHPKSDEDDVSSPIVLLDAFLSDDIAVPTDLGRIEPVDGRPAAVREIPWPEHDPPVKLWVAMIPYPDGFLRVLAWAPLAAPASYEQVVDIAKTVHRTSPPWALPDGLVLAPSIQEPIGIARSAMEGGVPTEHRAPETVPEGFEAVTYTSAVGELPAWASPVRSDGTPGPALLYLAGGFDHHTEATADDLQAFRDAGIQVMLPHLRGQAGIGPHELFGGELDDALAALEVLRARPDVDPERVYVLGYGTGSPLALLLAESTDHVRAVVTLEGTTDLGLVRQRFAELFGTDAYPASERQDALRSPTRFAAQLKAPVWAFHGEFSDDAVHGELMAAAAHRAGAPYHWALVPRAGTQWGSRLLDRMAEGIVADTGPQVDLGFDDEALQALAEAVWSDRVEALDAAVVPLAEALWHGHHLDDAAAVSAAVVQARGVIDGRFPLERARGITAEPRRPATDDRQRLDRVAARLADEGIALRLALPWSDLEAGVPEAERSQGYVLAEPDELAHAGPQGRLAFAYGDVVERTDEGTRRVGERFVAALEAEGFTPTWSGDPDEVVAVEGTWYLASAPSDAGAP